MIRNAWANDIRGCAEKLSCRPRKDEKEFSIIQ